MIPLMKRLGRFGRTERGSATVEFVILFPAFMTILLSGIETSVLMTRQLMLERSLDMVMREIRIGTMTKPTHDEVKQELCKRALVIPHCMSAVMLEMRTVDTTTWNVPLDGKSCVDRTEEVNVPQNFVPGQRNNLMMVRACAVFDPWFPTSGLGAQLPRDASGGYRLIATSGFVNEP
jgi:Flp pilus assembly protein TadG